jgi:hypothetical protein
LVDVEVFQGKNMKTLRILEVEFSTDPYCARTVTVLWAVLDGA